MKAEESELIACELSELRVSFKDSSNERIKWLTSYISPGKQKHFTNGVILFDL